MTKKLSPAQRALLIATALPNGTVGTGHGWRRTMLSLEKRGLVKLTKLGQYDRADATDAGRAALDRKQTRLVFITNNAIKEDA